MAEPILIAKNSEKELNLLPKMANRHGLIAGATGTGKTVTLQTLAEGFSRIGVPVFVADIKGDLSGISEPGGTHSKVTERLEMLGFSDFPFEGSPTTLWDIFGLSGHPLRATISEMGPILLSRVLQLNDTQTAVLNLAFKIADENGLLLLDFKDLRSMLQYVSENSQEFSGEYGNVSKASVGAIQRSLIELEQQGAEQFFGEPAVQLADFMQIINGKGVINILAADKLINAPKLYSTFLLWLLSELFEMLPEAGDLDKPKMVFFFDEAHLLFNDTPKALIQKIEQVVRLIRSKAVGIYFITQSPMDIPESILGQLGNRVQHALRAFTPKDQKAVRAAAQTFRENPALDVEETITQLGVGEGLVSFLDEKGTPSIVEKAYIMPPHSQIGPILPEQREALVMNSVVAGHYEDVFDRESAYELLFAKAEAAAIEAEALEKAELEAEEEEKKEKEEAKAARSSRSDSTATAFAKSAARAIGSNLGRQIVRGVLGGLVGGTTTRKRKKSTSWW